MKATDRRRSALHQVTRNSHVYEVHTPTATVEQWVFLAPDIHWDNPHCDRELLRKHLDQAVEKGARIIMPGDTFCLMQGAYDPRKQKGDIRPEHNVNHYIDAVIETAAEWFAPYQAHIDVIGLGNHETSILKRQETDVIARFVQALNLKAKGDHRVMAGGYGGWYTVRFMRSQTRKSYVMRYFHGSGGGAPVTKGTIQHNREAVNVEGADAMVMGHVHNDYHVTYTRESLDAQMRPRLKDVDMIRCGSYKDEYGDGYAGWHVERGGGPKPIGGRWLCLNFERGSGAKSPSITAYTHRAV